MSLAQRLAKLSPERRRLLERLAAVPRIERTAATEAPCSFEQERMWFLQQLDPGDASYHLHMHLALPATLDPAQWRAAWRWVVERHEVLRTRFVERDGVPVQVIGPPCEVVVEVVDLSAQDDEARRSASARLARQQAETPFDLARGPLLRVALLRWPAHWVQLLTVHHIVADGWSVELLMHELDAACAALARGVPVPLPPLPVQFQDFARWQRARLDGTRLEGVLDFWTRTLHGAPRLQLPADRARPAVFSHRAGVRSRLLPAALRARLDGLARREGATPFQLLLAAFAVLLHRCTGQDDLVFGTPVAQRDTPEVEGLIGFFLNTILLRVRLAPEQGFRQVLAATRQSTVEAYGAQQLPFARLVQHLQPERDLRRNPLYQATVQFLRSRAGGARTRATLDEVGYEAAQTNVDLAADFFEAGEGLLSRFEYSTDLFDDATVERLLDQWERLLAALAEQPDAAVGTLPLAGDEERRTLLHDWAGRGEPPPAGWVFCVGGEADADAVVGAHGALDRAELDARCARLASVLRAQGAGAERVVALRLSDPLDTLLGILAAWRAEAAFVFIDPAWPAARADALLDEVQPAVLLEDAGPWRAALQDAEPLPAPTAVPPQRLAALIFTSGSTGRPKAVAIEHGALALQLRWLQQALGVGARDVVLQKYSFAFDAALSELLAGLGCGARLVLAADRGRDAAAIVAAMRHRGVTLIDVVPAQLALLLDEPGFAACTTLRCVICGGDRLPAALVGRLLQQHPGVQLVNAYGPTEATITACAWVRPPAPPVPADAWREPPIGRPIPGTTAHVLDAALQPVPVGMQGQLHLGGGALARGYLHDEALTRERFVPNPFGPGRLHATGDRARWRADGQLEHLGRLDRQLKLRGIRIEPAEIEQALAAHPAVREACVVPLPLPAVPAEAAARMQWRLAQLSPPEADFLYRFETDHQGLRSRTMWRNTPDFDLYLDIQEPGFIATPRPAQRNWLLRRALDEAVADLQALQTVAQRCVAGAARPEMAGDWPARPAVYGGGQLLIDGQQVMQDWEAPLMQALAQAAAGARGDVAEIGFGMGLSAGFVQALKPRSHTIVECHPEVLAALGRWRAQRPGADIRVAACRWQDWDAAPESFDGLLFDTYPTSEDEYAAEVALAPTFAASFFATARRLLRRGGVFTYYTNEIDSLSRRHQRLLLEHFSSFSVSAVRGLQPPPDCQYWWADSMAVVAAVR